MDAQNVLFVTSSGLAGYKAGHFFSAALEVVLTPLTSYDRLLKLDTLTAHADLTHRAQLDAVLPDQTRELLAALRAGEMQAAVVLAHLAPVLEVLPALLILALPELAAALREYAEGRASGRAPRTWSPLGDDISDTVTPESGA